MSAKRFASALRYQMTSQGRRVEELAAEVSVHPSTIVCWRRGRKLPNIATASRLADALSAPRLLEMVARRRTLTCADCGRVFVYDNRGGRPRKYCSQRCGRNAWGHRYRQISKRRWGFVHGIWRNKAQRAQEAIDAMCNECADHEGICRVPDCKLRGLSPLPLVRVA